ncbi:hypothetical protein AB0A05_27110 [Streptomyces sp. NPDC046374]|uniref:hypothetical protein n=1 Tax=Streptomyces sp. NPDC046374 TaxID=3154917 RepID=UPI0033C0EF9E
MDITTARKISSSMKRQDADRDPTMQTIYALEFVFQAADSGRVRALGELKSLTPLEVPPTGSVVTIGGVDVCVTGVEERSYFVDEQGVLWCRVAVVVDDVPLSAS